MHFENMGQIGAGDADVGGNVADAGIAVIGVDVFYRVVYIDIRGVVKGAGLVLLFQVLVPGIDEQGQDFIQQGGAGQFVGNDQFVVVKDFFGES